MRRDFEEAVLHNPVLGAQVLWQFAREFADRSNDSRGPNLAEAMLVLPIVFHKASASSIERMQFDSGLLKALSVAPNIPVGLQDRLQVFSHKTWRSLNIACAAKLLGRAVIPGELPTFSPLRRSMPSGLKTSNSDTTRVLRASKRLGNWFARSDFRTICGLLQVVF